MTDVLISVYHPEIYMDSAAFASLATLQLPSPSRLLTSACCPDKDLVVIITRQGAKDKLSLWKMQGSKKWEVDVESAAHTTEEIVALAWSPDCKIAGFESIDPFLIKYRPEHRHSS